MDAQRGIARRMMISLPPEGLTAAWERDFAAYPPAGVIVFGRDFRDLEDLRRKAARLRELARPRRIFLAADEEGGFVSQLAPHLVVPPSATLLGRGAAPGEIEWAHRVTAARLRGLGLDWALAPVADVHSEPLNPVIGPRAFGPTAETVARRVGEALEGLEGGGVATCLKHFPGHGDTALDSHLALPVCGADREQLERRRRPAAPGAPRPRASRPRPRLARRADRLAHARGLGGEARGHRRARAGRAGDRAGWCGGRAVAGDRAGVPLRAHVRRRAGG